MGPVGRVAELAEIDALLEAAAAGSGGVVTLVGPQGSGKTALIAAAAEMARDRGFEVLGAAPVRGQPGRLVWAQLLHDAGATEEDSRELLHHSNLLAASAALRALTAGRRRLIVIDDIDTGGHDAVEVELARVDEAEVALAAYERAADASGDAEGSVVALSRHAMLAALRGRFDTAAALAEEFTARARRIGLPDAERLTAALHGGMLTERGSEPAWEAGLEQVYLVASRFPGHFYEATAARILAALGRHAEAAAELDRLLPPVLAASGPRWLGAVTDLSAVAAEVSDRAAAAQLYEALRPYAGGLVVWGGANFVNGPASYFLGLLATELGQADLAVAHFGDAIGMAERIGALPALARVLVALGDALASRGGDGDEQQAAALQRRALDIARRLDLAPLLRRLVTAAGEWALRRDGDTWLLEAGDERARIADSRGLQHLRALLAAPRRDISALDLAAGRPGLRDSAGAPVLDADAATSYKRRLAELAEELDEADAVGDAARASRAEAERQWLLGELRQATGLGGRIRRAPAESERARVNVTRTLRSALDRISTVAPRAGAHLQASIRTGLECRYDPAPGGPARWRV